MPRYHTRETVERALELLHKSADENGGTPNLSACSRALGLSRKALRLWWANRPPGGGPIGTGRPSESDRPAVVEVPPVEAAPAIEAAPPLVEGVKAPADRSVYAVALGMTDREVGYICAPRATAVQALGKIAPGFGREIVNRGQWSRIDLIQAILSQTGPADVLVSTWSIGIRDGTNLARMQADGLIRSMALVVNLANKTVEPHKTYWERMIGWFGAGNVYPCQVHSKFTVIQNDRYSVVIRTSANLTENIRLEQFSINDDPNMAAFYASVIRSWAGTLPDAWATGTRAINRAMKGALIDIETSTTADVPALHVLPTSANAAHSSSANAAHSSSANAAHPLSTNPAHLYALDEVAFIESQAHEAARLYNEAKRDRSYVAAGKMFDRMTELYVTLRSARQTAADAAGLDEAAFIERLEDEVRTIPDPHLEVYVREYLDRHRLQLVDAAAGG